MSNPYEKSADDTRLQLPAPASSSSAPPGGDKTRFRMPAPSLGHNNAEPTRFKSKPGAAGHMTVPPKQAMSPEVVAAPSWTPAEDFKPTLMMPRPVLSPDTKSAPRENSGASSGWGDPASWLATNAPLLGVGSVIKGRFVLEEPIGSGGMGAMPRSALPKELMRYSPNLTSCVTRSFNCM
jgi:hypothetical protein